MIEKLLNVGVAMARPHPMWLVPSITNANIEKRPGKSGGCPVEEILLHICHEQVGKCMAHPGGPHGNSPGLFVCVCIELKNVVI